VVSPVTDFTSACGGQNNEVEQAVAGHYVYEEWIGCDHHIGFATSADGGLHFGRPVVLPDSSGGWDPALAVAPSGSVYAAFMNATPGHSFPVVEASFDHGKTFPQVRRLVPVKLNDWGDRDFIAVGPTGAVYLTWDYGPSAKKIKIVCAQVGSCSFAAGDLNIVLRKSADGGKTWGPMVPVSPGYPASGADSGPLLAARDGKIYVDYHAFGVTSPTKLTLSTAHSFVTWSSDGGKTWSKPVRVGPEQLTMNTVEWWVDGDISADAAGNLYATWDSQVSGRDIGWLAYSTDHGRTWATVRVTPDTDSAAHIVQVAGGSGGIAYVGWLADNSQLGYALYLREFKIGKGWLSPIIQVSRQYGNKAIWPGDTFGISVEPAARSGPLAGKPRVVVSWGSATHKVSEDRAAIVIFR
jgi:BNR/Asp-box repeat